MRLVGRLSSSVLFLKKNSASVPFVPESESESEIALVLLAELSYGFDPLTVVSNRNSRNNTQVTLQLLNKWVHSRLAALRWISMLLTKMPGDR